MELIFFETANKYTVFDTSGNAVFKIEEDTTCCNRFCCGVLRSFNVMIMDMQGQPFIQVVSPNACNLCCLRSSSPGSTPRLRSRRRTEKPSSLQGVLSVLTGNAEFVLTDNKGEEVGKISKKWGGALKEMFTDADTFSVTFPKDLDSKTKAILFGTAILVDFAYFEDNN